MSKRKTKPRHQKPARRPGDRAIDSRTVDATTVAWTVSVTTVFLTNIGAVAAHLYSDANPQLQGVALLSNLLLFAAAIIGLISLVLLPAVMRMRRTAIPNGFVAFAVCNGLAPILALIMQSMQR